MVGEVRYNSAPLIEASMLLIEAPATRDGAVLEVGSTCGVCPKERCPGRREPSILNVGL
jgi:predicted transcriptional regulator